jgi:hypothetical protein
MLHLRAASRAVQRYQPVRLDECLKVSFFIAGQLLQSGDLPAKCILILHGIPFSKHLLSVKCAFQKLKIRLKIEKSC